MRSPYHMVSEDEQQKFIFAGRKPISEVVAFQTYSQNRVSRKEAPLQQYLLIKHKYGASEYLIAFCKMVDTQFWGKVKRIRSDNGGEFTSNCMMRFYIEHGIANLPIDFWGKCVLTSTYIINRFLSKVVGNKTLYEILFDKRLIYEHMRVFGQKRYRVYDLEAREIVISCDVKFTENNLQLLHVQHCDQFISPIYRLDNILKVYGLEFQPTGNEEYWPPYFGPSFIPNPVMHRK
ncbi:hypothetical protein Lal_00011982 [Lupinus albus]|nr:hypothetical protein Lal_00011982 [Lupinus albus]